jgi:hypothetical protein
VGIAASIHCSSTAKNEKITAKLVNCMNDFDLVTSEAKIKIL